MRAPTADGGRTLRWEASCVTDAVTNQQRDFSFVGFLPNRLGDGWNPATGEGRVGRQPTEEGLGGVSWPKRGHWTEPFASRIHQRNKTQWTRLKKFQKDDRYQLTLVSIYSFTAFPNRGSPPISTKKGPNRPAAPSSGEIQLLDARHDNADGLCAAASRQDHP